MMSSLIRQKEHGHCPDIFFDVAYPRNNGNPSTEEVCYLFKDLGLKIIETQYEGMDEIQFRGLVRNRQIAQCKTEWILFADTDMVYDDDFFDDLGMQLEGELKNEGKVISARRVSLDKDYCKNFFNNEDKNTYPCYIASPAKLCSTWPIYQVSRNVGAGYFQLASMESIQAHGGIYVDPENNSDWSWNKMQKANSDRQFRKMMGGIRRIKTKPQYHLNHERDNEAGTHLTIQR